MSEEARAALAAAGIRRATFEVELGDEVELVSVSVRDDEILCVASDGRTDGPFVAAALSLLGAKSAPGEPASTEKAQVATRVDRDSELADVLDDLLTAVVRVGAREASGSPSFDEAIERLNALYTHARTQTGPAPLGVARFIGRLRAALREDDATTLSRLLDGASRLVGNLRSDARDPDARKRVSAWLGRPRTFDTFHDRVLVEVGREWVDGAERGAIERRYLAQIGDGEIFLEERERDTPGSVGACPRYVRVGLAEVDRGPTPRRVRLLQYAAAPTIRSTRLSELGETAIIDFDELAFNYRYELKSFPALAEPFVIVAPNRCERDGRKKVVLFDAESRPLPVAVDDQGISETLALMAEEHDIAWLAGRVIDVYGVLMLMPFSAVAREASALSFHRLR